MDTVRIDLAAYKNIVFLTGAGISVASGIRSYRGPDGLWNDETLRRLSHGSTLRSDPLAVWRFFSDQRLTLITQNIDGLHTRAGSQNVIEFHGAVRRSRCINTDCTLSPFEDANLYREFLPLCPVCGSMLRPDVVLFQEFIPARLSAEALKALVPCDLFVAIGTSATVWPANQFVRGVFERGARTVFLNLAPLDGNNIYFQEQYLGKAEELLPALFGSGIEVGALEAPPEPEVLGS